MLKRPMLIIAVALTAGCAARQAQVAVQASLTGIATGLVAADEAVAEAMPDAAAEARDQVLRESGDSIDQGLARYDVLMRPWADAIDALRTARAALYLAQAGVTTWVDTGALPASWTEVCSDVEATVEALVELLRNLGVELPASVSLLAGFAEQVCSLARPWSTR